MLGYGILGRIAVYAAAVIFVWVFGFTVGIHKGNVKIEQAKTTALQIKEKQSVELAKSIKLTQDKYDSAIEVWRNSNAALLAGVRSRSNRKLPGSPVIVGECPPATGKELSREDAEFLIGVASDAQRESEALEACYGREDNYRRLMQGATK